MKKIGLLLMAGVFLVVVNAGAEEGDNIFKAQGCGTCHKPEMSKTNPSLKEIAQAYQGKEDQLLGYLKGETEPFMKPTKANMMKRALEKTKALSDADRKALADFIMTHGK